MRKFGNYVKSIIKQIVKTQTIKNLSKHFVLKKIAVVHTHAKKRQTYIYFYISQSH